MVIYGEYLFLENFIVGLILLFFTGKIVGKRLRLPRLLLCSACCGAYAFILFTSVHGFFSLLLKIFFSIGMVSLAFGKQSKQQTLQNALLFMGITVLYGGVVIALLTSFGWAGVTAAAGVYLPPMTYMTVTVAAVAATLFLTVLMDLIRQKRVEARVTVDVRVQIGTKEWMRKGLIDSGNSLKEPFTGKPVCIVRRDFMEEILKETDDRERRYTVVPYRAVGVERGILEGYRADAVCIPGKTVHRPVLAICEEQSFLRENSELQILLPESMLERGIYGDFSSNKELAD